jgi:DNA-binding NarL/FixJ family response regulator
MLKIVVADDVDLVLRGIQSILADWRDGQIVGVYQSVSELLQGIRSNAADVVILDDRIDPDHAPLRMIAQIKAAAPNVRIIVLGTVVDGMVVQEFFAHGIHGFLYKSDTLADMLIPAIRAVMMGKLYLSPTASAEHMIAIQGGRRRWQLDDESLVVLRLLADGNHVNRIAHQLKTTPSRVYTIRNKLRARFGAENNESMISRATAEGFLP